MEDVVAPPGVQLNTPPAMDGVAVIVAEPPLQIPELLIDCVTDPAFATVTIAVSGQPISDVPIT